MYRSAISLLANEMHELQACADSVLIMLRLFLLSRFIAVLRLAYNSFIIFELNNGLVLILTTKYLMKLKLAARLHKLKIHLTKQSLEYFEKLINWQQNIYRELTRTPPTAYNSLSPIDDVDPKDFKEYDDALTWALNNREAKDIKNIAITGPYGSGKSSVLKTYQKNYGGTEFKFLNISLATFKEETADGENDRIPPKEEMLRLIELSILQQIFYHERDEKIPDSRFKKIKRHTWKHLLIGTCYWFLCIIAIVGFKYSNVYDRLVKDLKITRQQISMLDYILAGIAMVWILILIWRSIRLLSKISINKLTFQDTEIEISDKVSKSILNHHLDELLYFFEATDHNIVIIEDLDRFQQTEVFTKLREINLLLNSSEKISKHIVFIYAVKDDMFKDKDRAKFFDFIVPIIPVINSSNSSQKLLEKKDLNSYKWNEDLIENLALFIDDMRLLHNIVNEFHLYHRRLSPILDQNKLLAMLVYKNIYPDDFAVLSNAKGVLYNALNAKNGYIEQLISDNDAKISNTDEEINRLEELRILNKEDIRRLYLIRYFPRLKGFISFIVNGVDRTIDDMLEDENFDYIKSNQAQYRYETYNGNRTAPLPISFSDLQKQVDSAKDYDQFISDMEAIHSGKVEALKKSIVELEKEKGAFRNFKIKEVLAKGNIKIDIKEKVIKDGKVTEVTDISKTALVNVLLRNGYIDEHYSDYISIFYEGSLTKTDHQFLLNVKSQTTTDHAFALVKTSELIKKINLIDFEQPFILNHNLFDFVNSGNSLYKKQKEALLNQLKNESETSIAFIKGMIDSSKNVRLFILNLAKYWPNLWKYIEASNFTQDEKSLFFKSIIEYADITDIKRISDVSLFIDYLLADRKFLSIIPDADKLKKIIKALDIKFTDLDSNSLPGDLLKYVYENNNYSLNPTMVTLMMKSFGKFNQSDFDKRNYFSIKNSECDKLISYVDNDINDYVTNVYLPIETNVNEEEESLIALLNLEQLKEGEEIISKVETKISDLEDIPYQHVAELLMSYAKVSPTWDNVFIFWLNAGEATTEPLVKFLGYYENMQVLSSVQIQTDKNGETAEQRKKFIRQLLITESLSDELYLLMSKSLPYIYNGFDVTTLTRARAEILIESNTLNLTVELFNALKIHHPDLHIKLIEKHPSVFTVNIAQFVLTVDDALALFESNKLTNAQKTEIITKEGDVFILGDQHLVNSIARISVGDKGFIYSDEILKQILKTSNRSVTDKITIFNDRHTHLSADDITEFLQTLPEPYSIIAKKRKKPKIPRSIQNEQFANILKAVGYISTTELKEESIKINTFSN